MTATERFLRYITFDTESDESSGTVPSTEKQKDLGAWLVRELAQLGAEGPHMDGFGYVYGWLPATPGREGDPTVALIAHMDTAPRVSGRDVKARIVAYDGGDVCLNEGLGIVMREADFPDLRDNLGKHLIVTDGTTLLGADDKAGIAEIFAALEQLGKRRELAHGRVAVCITPDEEIGRGADRLDLAKLGAAYGYTVDGGPLGTLEYENFNAAGAEVRIRGVNIHPGEGKNKMKNACLLAAEFISLLPPAETPAHTEGYEGFYHLCTMAGDESQTCMEWLIRDHDGEKFQARKEFIQGVGAYLNWKYGDGTVEVLVEDSYRNMKEKILPHPEILDRARAAFRRAGVEPVDRAIRGGTDGAKLSFLGLPCPNLSTGGYHYHGVYEYIPRESLEKMTEVLVNLLAGTDEDHG
ncbi:MAG: peptidase T [Ruminiclostridium sp.]|nr:peptidase T [Ruminiclostridium sp.]